VRNLVHKPPIITREARIHPPIALHGFDSTEWRGFRAGPCDFH
jgi:hypothetical protein